MIAAPSQVEMLHKKYKQEKEARERERRQMLLEKYGTGDASYLPRVYPDWDDGW